MNIMFGFALHIIIIYDTVSGQYIILFHIITAIEITWCSRGGRHSSTVHNIREHRKYLYIMRTIYPPMWLYV